MGASSDGLVMNPSEIQSNGLVEINCPVRAEKFSSCELCTRRNRNQNTRYNRDTLSAEETTQLLLASARAAPHHM